MTIVSGSKENQIGIILRKQFVNVNNWNSPIDKDFIEIVPSKRPTLSWIFKSFAMPLPLPLTKLRSLNSVSMGDLVNTWETPTGSLAAVI